MKKTIIISAVFAIISLTGLLIYIKLSSGNQKVDFAEVKKGVFEIAVSSTGELIAENSINIKGPNIVSNRNFRSAAIKITDLVPEGTEVRKGDYIATLDRSNFNNSLKDEQESLRTKETELELKLLDTALTLSSLRDDIKNQFFVVEEASITVDQSKYEPPAVQRQAAIRLDKEQRAFHQKRKLYLLKSAQAKAELRNLKINVATQRRKVDDLDAILAAFTITAPSDGMVIYKKDRIGKKITAGAMLNPFDAIVATLPDLSSMLSKVYISEIEVNKIKIGQPVEIRIDAFQGKGFTGKVSGIANIGEQLSNSDSKVFEVLVKLDDSDPLLRPSMTTSNKVIIQTFDNVFFVPSESVHAGIDSIPFVYTKEGNRQVVMLGESNEKNVIIENGLKEGTPVWLSTPENPEKYSIAGTELIPIIREREKARSLELNSFRDSGSGNFTVISEKNSSSGSAGSMGSD